MHFVYETVLLPLRAAAVLRSALLGPFAGGRDEWEARTARRLPARVPGAVWIHGASVGEARIVRSLAAALRDAQRDTPIVVSAVTRTGLALLPDTPDVAARFLLPLDVAAWQRRLIEALRPGILVLVETELWPNLLLEAHRSGVTVCVANGRLSSKRMGRYGLLRRLYAPLLREIAAVGAQSAEDASRYVRLGLPEGRVTVTGNLKFDLPGPGADRATVRRELGLGPERLVVAAGSTGAGESGLVLDAFVRARRRFPSLYLILAPRHPDRATDAEREARALGLACTRASRDPAADAARGDVLLVDGVGRLARLYAAADAAFVGGSLVTVGGHNVLEPAAAGVPVLFGPHTENVAAPAEALVRSGGARRVADPRDLGEAWVELLADREARERAGAAAAAVVFAHRGALARTVDLILAARRAGENGPGRIR